MLKIMLKYAYNRYAYNFFLVYLKDYHNILGRIFSAPCSPSDP